MRVSPQKSCEIFKNVAAASIPFGDTLYPASQTASVTPDDAKKRSHLVLSQMVLRT